MQLPDVSDLLRSIEPQVRPGEFVYVDGAALPDDVRPEMVIREEGGVSAIVTREVADSLALGYDFIGAWITIRATLDVDTAGKTAAVATVLARGGISVRIVSGTRHDHLLVPMHRADDALSALRRLAAAPRGT